MSTSLETLRFAKESVTKARSKSEKLITEMTPNIAKLATPIDQRILELRGFVQGLIAGQDEVLSNVRALAPAAQLPALVAAAEKVTAPETHWSEKFEATLAPLIEGEEKSQQRAKAFLTKLAQRVRTLVVWEGVLDQLITAASPKLPTSPDKPTEPKPAPVKPASPRAAAPARPAIKPAVLKASPAPAANGAHVAIPGASAELSGDDLDHVPDDPTDKITAADEAKILADMKEDKVATSDPDEPFDVEDLGEDLFDEGSKGGPGETTITKAEAPAKPEVSKKA